MTMELTVLSLLDMDPSFHKLFPDLPTRYNCQKLHRCLWKEADLSGVPFFSELVIFVLKAKGYFNTPSYLAWAFQSGSPLKPDFDRVILKLSEVHKY